MFRLLSVVSILLATKNIATACLTHFSHKFTLNMKNVILFLALTATQCAVAQSLPDLIRKYEKECSQIVPDTIKQYGNVTYDLVPVKDAKGEILHYALGTPDTVWQEPSCPEYKDGYTLLIRSGSIRYIPDSTTLFGSSPSLNGPISGSEKPQKTVVPITRSYICQVKLREVEPFSEHFWDWLKKQ